MPGALSLRRRRTLAFLLLAAACLAGTPARAADEDEAPEWSFVPGRYQLIGRHPDSLSTYTGTARIERVGKQLRLTRTIGGRKSQVFSVSARSLPILMLSMAALCQPAEDSRNSTDSNP